MEGSRGSERSDDPFDGFSILSLLPRTVGTASVPPPSSQAHEAESIRCFLKSAVGESTKDVVEQAKVIDKSYQCGVGVTEGDEFVMLAEGKDRHQGRRPALGRKRAQFSLKPVASRDSIPVVDAGSEIQHIEDPEEYFLAFEQLENANRELKKLRGDILTNPVQNDQKGTRQRRPGLLGKTASYKHHFSAMDAAPETCKVLQDLAPDNGSSSVRMSDNSCCNAVDQPVTLQPMNTSDLPFDSRKKADNKEDAANTLLDNLLSSFKEVGEGEEEAMLRKSLHIKSIDVGKIDLPELHTVQLIDPKASNTSVMQNRSSICQLTQTSTSQTRSPLAAISALYKRISLKSQLKTPYLVSPFSMDSDPGARKARRIVSPVVVSNGHNEISSPVHKLSLPHTGNEAINVDSSKTAEELTIGRNYVYKNITEQSQNIVDNGINIHDQLEEVENDMHSFNLLSKDACPEVDHLTSNCQTKELMSTDLEGDAGHSSWGSDANASLCNDMDDVIDPSPEVEHSTPDCHEKTMTKSLRSDDDTRLSHAHHILQDKVNVMTEDEQLAGLDCSTVSPCPSTPLPPTDGPAAVASTLSRENDEVHSSQGFQNETGKQKSYGTKQNKEKLKSKRQTRAGAASQTETGKLKSLRTRQRKEKLKSSRQSLAGDGLAWQSGVRRSTRIRSRPLEFWRGERFLYGRIHDSLATVIGVKYASPGKEESSKGKVLKVKSFVSGEYEDLVSQAAS